MALSSLIVAVTAQITCQLYKIVVTSIRRGRVTLSPFIQSGGMPSAHSAFVSALSASVGIRAGFASEIFGIAAVFSLIVIHDSVRLRGEVAAHARVLNRLLPSSGSEARRPLNEGIGHSVGEIAVGAIWGVVWAVLVGRSM